MENVALTSRHFDMHIYLRGLAGRMSVNNSSAIKILARAGEFTVLARSAIKLQKSTKSAAPLRYFRHSFRFSVQVLFRIKSAEVITVEA